MFIQNSEKRIEEHSFQEIRQLEWSTVQDEFTFSDINVVGRYAA